MDYGFPDRESEAVDPDETDKEVAPDAELASDTDAKQAEAVVPEGEKKAEEVAGPDGEKKAEDVAGPEGEKKAEEASLNYVVSVEGLDIGDTYFVDYSYDGETWYGAKVEDEKEEHTVITVEEGFNCIWFDLKNIPEGGIPEDGFVSIRVTGKSASPAMAFLSFSLTDYDDKEEVFEPEGVNFKPDGDENGIYMTVDVPLSHILTDPEPLFRRLNVMAAYIDSGNPAIVEEAHSPPARGDFFQQVTNDGIAVHALHPTEVRVHAGEEGIYVPRADPRVPIANLHSCAVDDAIVHIYPIEFERRTDERATLRVVLAIPFVGMQMISEGFDVLLYLLHVHLALPLVGEYPPHIIHETTIVQAIVFNL